MEKEKHKPRYKFINGICVPFIVNEKCFKEALNYTPASDDVFIATYPKSGTTWMQILALHIFRKGRELEDYKMFHNLCPYLDGFGYQSSVNMPRPGAMKTHLPHNLIPYSPDAKYIYVLRNPKDCCVSLYCHMKSNRAYGWLDANFNNFFDQFMDGEVIYNDYFDHLKSWEGFRNSKQVFFTTYENMKTDTTQVVLQLSSFLGREYIEAIEKDNKVLKNILQFSSFEYMKKHVPDVFDYCKLTDEELNSPNMLYGLKYMALCTRSLPPLKGKRSEIIRKGEIDDWKNYFSAEQSERLNQKFVEQTQGTEIYYMYKHFME